MRTLLEIFVVAVLLTLTWQQSLQQRLSTLTGRQFGSAPTSTTTAPAAPAAAPAARPVVAATPQPRIRYVTLPPAPPAPTASGDWMWDPAHRSTLDRQSYSQRDQSQHAADAARSTYWIDGRGEKHFYQSSGAPPAPYSPPPPATTTSLPP